jgi:hypothetical protein
VYSSKEGVNMSQMQITMLKTAQDAAPDASTVRESISRLVSDLYGKAKASPAIRRAAVAAPLGALAMGAAASGTPVSMEHGDTTEDVERRKRLNVIKNAIFGAVVAGGGAAATAIKAAAYWYVTDTSPGDAPVLSDYLAVPAAVGGGLWAYGRPSVERPEALTRGQNKAYKEYLSRYKETLMPPKVPGQFRRVFNNPRIDDSKLVGLIQELGLRRGQLGRLPPGQTALEARLQARIQSIEADLKSQLTARQTRTLPGPVDRLARNSKLNLGDRLGIDRRIAGVNLPYTEPLRDRLLSMRLQDRMNVGNRMQRGMPIDISDEAVRKGLLSSKATLSNLHTAHNPGLKMTSAQLLRKLKRGAKSTARKADPASMAAALAGSDAALGKRIRFLGQRRHDFGGPWARHVSPRGLFLRAPAGMLAGGLFGAGANRLAKLITGGTDGQGS